MKYEPTSKDKAFMREKQKLQSEILRLKDEIRYWNARFSGSYHLFGHIHNNSIIRTDLKNRFNVGVDANNFEPKTLDELMKGE